MAKITITIEDLPGDKVKVVAEPNFQTMAMMATSGHELSPAHGYALRMINSATALSKEKSSKSIIHIPKLSRPLV